MSIDTEIGRLPTKRYSEKNPRVHTVLIGSGEAGLRPFDSKDRIDMQTLVKIMRQRDVRERFDFSWTNPFEFAKFDSEDWMMNHQVYAVVPGIGSTSASAGEAIGFIWFYFGEEERQFSADLVNKGILPMPDPHIPLFEIGFAKRKDAPPHLISRAIIQACLDMNQRKRTRVGPFHSTAPDTLKILTPEEEESMTPAQKILHEYPLDTVIYAFVGQDTVRTARTPYVVDREKSLGALKSAGFKEVGMIPDVEDEKGLEQLHIFLLDPRKLNQIVHERADREFESSKILQGLV
ncbi:hypothetical protein HY408_02260 [Candidatus Gottesmanbacteria bacterium]|nr:hypothetical protein [Candidatus Gottesmanbacteria bacterium]